MYFNDSGEQLKESDSEREYFVAAEVFISNAASATLRKVGYMLPERTLTEVL